MRYVIATALWLLIGLAFFMPSGQVAFTEEPDTDGDGVLDEYELEKAMEAEARTRWDSWNELSSTHPATFKRILQLKQIEEEIRGSGEMGGNIYKHI